MEYINLLIKILDTFQDSNIIKNGREIYITMQNSGKNLDFDKAKYNQILNKYYKLTTLEELSEQDAQSLDGILQLAETDETLSFLLNEVDEITFQELGFYEHNDLDYWSNEKAKIQEFVITSEDNSDSEYKNILTEYYELATCTELSEQDAQCLDKILELAETDKYLSSLLNQIDEQTFEELGFYEKEKLENNNRHQTETVKNISDSDRTVFDCTYNLIYILIDSKLLLGLLKGEKESDTLMDALSKTSAAQGYVSYHAHRNFIVHLSVLKGQKLSERSSLDPIKVVKISDIHFEYASELNLNAESALDLELALDYNLDAIVTNTLEDFQGITQLPIPSVKEFIICIKFKRYLTEDSDTEQMADLSILLVFRDHWENQCKILEKEHKRVTNNLERLELELTVFNEKYTLEIIRRLTKLYYLNSTSFKSISKEVLVEAIEILKQLVEAIDIEAIDIMKTKSYTEDLGDGVELKMVSIPGGKFMMGTPRGEGRDSEKPQHEVTVQPFFMGKYPITQRQYQKVMGKNPSFFKGDERPVEQVSWDDAVEFCNRLSKYTKHTDKEYRLPTEAEWEYACRSVISKELTVEEWNQQYNQPFHFGETISTELANYDGNYTYGRGVKGENRFQTTPVDSFPPNTFGLYDMHGNVWEWCQDDWHENYEGAPTDGSARVSGKSSIKKYCVVVHGSTILSTAVQRTTANFHAIAHTLIVGFM